MTVGAICALLQPLSGDLLAKFVFNTQPAKFAAMEGQFKTERYAPLRLGGMPNETRRETRFAIEIPGGLSFMATHDPSSEVRGLDSIPRENWPNLHVTHFAFQIMVGLGTLMMTVAIWFWLVVWRKRELAGKWLMRALVICSSFGFIALEAGWFVTEVGRQPWTIQPNAAIGYAGMRTAEAVTRDSAVSPLFFGFAVLYGVLALVVIILLRGLMDPHQPAPQHPAVEKESP
jgi:cytochrome d ubiquinol oxidase subunit I